MDMAWMCCKTWIGVAGNKWVCGSYERCVWGDIVPYDKHHYLLEYAGTINPKSESLYSIFEEVAPLKNQKHIVRNITSLQECFKRRKMRKGIVVQAKGVAYILEMAADAMVEESIFSHISTKSSTTQEEEND